MPDPDRAFFTSSDSPSPSGPLVEGYIGDRRPDVASSGRGNEEPSPSEAEPESGPKKKKKRKDAHTSGMSNPTVLKTRPDATITGR